MKEITTNLKNLNIGIDLELENFKKKTVHERLLVKDSIESIIDYRLGDESTHNEQYLIKWKNLSYIHSSWVNKDHISDSKLIENYKNSKVDVGVYREIDSILDSTDDNEYYLVKWKSLLYENSTWEKKVDLDLLKDNQIHIENYMNLKLVKEHQLISTNDFVPVQETPSNFTINGVTLKDIQLQGLSWLLFNYIQKKSGVMLCDESGLGKKIQSIAFLETLRVKYQLDACTNSSIGPNIIIAPLSTIAKWQEEIKKWSDPNKLFIDLGNTNQISQIELSMLCKYRKFNILLTTFEFAVTHCEILSNVKWNVMLIDQAHILNNPNSKLFLTLKRYSRVFTLLSTNSPIRNSSQELWSLLNIVDPLKFNDLTSFENELNTPIPSDYVNKLHSILLPYLLRRMKSDE